MFRRVAPALAAGLIATTLGFAPTAAAADTASTARTAAVRSYDHCRTGYFCIYSDWGGGGTQCSWASWQYPRVANTADMCSFIRNGHPVRSVANRTDHRVQYYTGTNYNHRVGSTTSGGAGNLQGSYQIRSFRPQ
ncbi:peptidase inhibitor family I36 protein [Kitasatospora sp. NPDC059795]|uniref:peptidase inhibitor family I36 protein n=1 Tax=unclassified Kitasatospora TaxID=2633591 RepID=UPI00093FEF35|nr:peptidase inhibitor family I36 protein [Kitasatospora sp. CB01950]OKJ13529.1 peptidase inhibitor [Kitasatospora sp. CB01950]